MGSATGTPSRVLSQKQGTPSRGWSEAVVCLESLGHLKERQRSVRRDGNKRKQEAEGLVELRVSAFDKKGN